jgi:hypothetical protein
MKFDDIFISRENYFSLGFEEVSGAHYLSIPVGNRDYDEYYRITPTSLRFSGPTAARRCSS